MLSVIRRFAFVITVVATFCLTLLLPRLSAAKSLPDGWILINLSAEGKWSSINLRTLTLTGNPRLVVSFAYFEMGSTGYQPWELHCGELRIKANGISHSIASDANTVRSTIYSGLCGFQYEGVMWTMIGALQVSGDPTKLNSFIFMDLGSIRSIDSPFFGRSAQVLEAAFESKTFRPIGRMEFAYDCNNPVAFGSRVLGTESFNVHSEKLTANTFGHSTSILACSDKFFVATGSGVPSQSLGLEFSRSGGDLARDKSLESIKKTCADLGFPKSTEKFGECVLRLSR